MMCDEIGINYIGICYLFRGLMFLFEMEMDELVLIFFLYVNVDLVFIFLK